MGRNAPLGVTMRDEWQPNNWPPQIPDQPSATPTPSASDSPSADDASTQSRRRFLRTAIISGVAVATVGSSIGLAAEASSSQQGVLSRFGINLGTASGSGGCSMCFENTEYQAISKYTVHSGHASPPEYFVWLTAHNLAPGSYTMSISPDPTNTSSSFKLASSGNNAFLFLVDANKAKDCPTCDSRGSVHVLCANCAPKDPVRTNHSVDGLFSTAYTIAGSSHHDLQLQVHIKWDGTHLSSNHTYAFTGTVKNSQGAVVCSSSVSVTAQA